MWGASAGVDAVPPTALAPERVARASRWLSKLAAMARHAIASVLPAMPAIWQVHRGAAARAIRGLSRFSRSSARLDPTTARPSRAEARLPYVRRWASTAHLRQFTLRPSFRKGAHHVDPVPGRRLALGACSEAGGHDPSIPASAHRRLRSLSSAAAASMNRISRISPTMPLPIIPYCANIQSVPPGPDGTIKYAENHPRYHDTYRVTSNRSSGKRSGLAEAGRRFGYRR